EVMNEMLEAPALVARTRQSWAAALAEGGADDRARASEKAQAAFAVAEELDLPGIARDAARTLELLPL
ncbi:MAG: hypothetical protein OEV40_30415, partial [Acidimicrobiia bacterium]|nr:hypothetical protein [Acidimicrobiia bacterium]